MLYISRTFVSYILKEDLTKFTTLGPADTRPMLLQCPCGSGHFMSLGNLLWLSSDLICKTLREISKLDQITRYQHFRCATCFGHFTRCHGNHIWIGENNAVRKCAMGFLLTKCWVLPKDFTAQQIYPGDLSWDPNLSRNGLTAPQPIR